MDDFVLANLHESRNEWCSRLVSIFTPLVIEGFKSIFTESWKMCTENDEMGKYLMTFQNLLSRVPKWNSIIVEEERKRIIERSGCNYLEDLITCVHIIQLKVLTCIRVGNKQKKIDISIPKLDHFIHKVYIHAARKLYMNVYLFEKNIMPLLAQKNARELEAIIQECILTTVRESIPTEAIIRAYMEEYTEHEEEVTIEQLAEPVVDPEEEHVTETNEPIADDKDKDNYKDNDNDKDKDNDKYKYIVPATVPVIANLDNTEVVTRLAFNDMDSILDSEDKEHVVSAPKTLERLDSISTANAIKRKLEEEEEDDSDRIKIHTDDSLDLNLLDVMDVNGKSNAGLNSVSLFDVEELF
jgi:hypothetical protein